MKVWKEGDRVSYKELNELEGYKERALRAEADVEKLKGDIARLTAEADKKTKKEEK
jgi:hypothetical protein